MKPKLNIVDIPVRDQCQTPPKGLTPLLPFIQNFTTIWEPACGEGYLTQTLVDNNFNVVSGDIIHGSDFFQIEKECDAIVTNPPYSIKYKWLARCRDLNKPFALLMPLETLGAAKAQKVFKEVGGVMLIILNRRLNFKMPNKGWDGSGAQFPVAWFCCGFGEEYNNRIIYGDV